MAASTVEAFAPGRVNLVGEHTDYNGGLALPFAIGQGVTVSARAVGGPETTVVSRTLGERDRFVTASPDRCKGWRAFARGVVERLRSAGHELPSAELEITSDLPMEAGLSSSAALEVALALALLALAGERELDRLALARLCSGVESEWLGAHTGLLDQLASLFGARGLAVLIDFREPAIERVPLELGGWTLATVATRAERALAASAYNERRDQCARAAELVGVSSLREASIEQIDALPEVLRKRARHVFTENKRVRAAVAAIRRGRVELLGELLDRSHASLRDDYEVSTPAVEEAVRRVRDSGAVGARLIGGGFGGTVLALFPPGAPLPADAIICGPEDGARVTTEGG